MKQIIYPKKNAYKVGESADPEPGPDEVLIEVVASGINFADIMATKGLYPDAPKFPFVAGYEVSGRITAVGKDVDDSWIGEEVAAITRFGGYSDKVVVSLGQLVKKPTKLTHEQAASIPVVYLTAWMLIVVQGNLRKGETILIQNAGSGVGLAAIDIARHIGAHTIGTASGRKHPFLKERGLEHAIDYRTENWQARVRELTNNRGVDLIIDPLGSDSWRQGYKLLAPCGRIGFYGASSITDSRWGWLIGALKFFLQMPFFSPMTLMSENRSVFGSNLGHMNDNIEIVHGWFEEIMQGVREGWVRPHYDRVFSFDEIKEAHKYIIDRKSTGKVLLVPGKNKEE